MMFLEVYPNHTAEILRHKAAKDSELPMYIRDVSIYYLHDSDHFQCLQRYDAKSDKLDGLIKITSAHK